MDRFTNREGSCLSLSRRLREVREELFGVEGVSRLAGMLGLPPQTWRNYEEGVTIPAVNVLLFIELTHVKPHWLLSGEGRKFNDSPWEDSDERTWRD